MFVDCLLFIAQCNLIDYLLEQLSVPQYKLLVQSTWQDLQERRVFAGRKGNNLTLGQQKAVALMWNVLGIYSGQWVKLLPKRHTIPVEE